MVRTYNSTEKEAILGRVCLEKAEESPLLDILLNRASPVKYDAPVIKKSYRVMSMNFHPDRTDNEPEELKTLYEELFKEISMTYHDITDLRQGCFIGSGEIPWSIKESHKEIDKNNNSFSSYLGKLAGIEGFRDRLSLTYSDRSKIELETSSDPSNFAQLELFKVDPKAYDLSDFLKMSVSVIKNPKEVMKYVELKKTEPFNKDLSDIETVLTYGLWHDTIEMEYWPIGAVSIKHLYQRGAFDAPVEEWVTIDKCFVRPWGYLQSFSEDNPKDLPLGYKERSDTIYKKENYLWGAPDILASIEPSTMIMNNKDGSMFVARAPYHKLFLPKGNRLVLIENYSANGNKLARTDSLQKTTRLYDPNFEDILIQARILPWTCLSPKSVEQVKDYAVRLLEIKKELK